MVTLFRDGGWRENEGLAEHGGEYDDESKQPNTRHIYRPPESGNSRYIAIESPSYSIIEYQF